MARLMTHILTNALAIWLAAWTVKGISFKGSWLVLIFAGAVMGFVNFFIKPLIKIISLPLIWITLGLFTIVINILLLVMVANIVPNLVVKTWTAAFWGVVVISAVNYIVSFLIKEEN